MLFPSTSITPSRWHPSRAHNYRKGLLTSLLDLTCQVPKQLTAVPGLSRVLEGFVPEVVPLREAKSLG
jgi:hypothetical protein